MRKKSTVWAHVFSTGKKKKLLDSDDRRQTAREAAPRQAKECDDSEGQSAGGQR